MLCLREATNLMSRARKSVYNLNTAEIRDLYEFKTGKKFSKKDDEYDELFSWLCKKVLYEKA